MRSLDPGTLALVDEVLALHDEAKRAEAKYVYARARLLLALGPQPAAYTRGASTVKVDVRRSLRFDPARVRVALDEAGLLGRAATLFGPRLRTVVEEDHEVAAATEGIVRPLDVPYLAVVPRRV